MGSPEQQRSPELRKNFRVKVEDLIPGIKPVDPEYKFNPDAFRDSRASASEYLLGRMIEKPEVYRFFSEWRDQVVVDIGTYNTEDYMVACAAKARGYIAVEPLNYDLLEAAFGKLKKIRIPVGRMVDYATNIPYALVKADAVGFLRRLPPWSVSVMMLSTDPSIMPDSKYREWLRGQIQRVLHNEGAFIRNLTVGFSLGADFVRHNFEKEEPEIADFFLTKYTRKKP